MDKANELKCEVSVHAHEVRFFYLVAEADELGVSLDYRVIFSLVSIYKKILFHFPALWIINKHTMLFPENTVPYAMLLP